MSMQASGERRKFWVYFEQVNAVRIKVIAEDQESAKERAIAEWRRSEGKFPSVASIEEATNGER
jgi:hypothetical protein